MYGGAAMNNMNKYNGTEKLQQPLQNPFAKSQRRRLNIMAVLVALFAPWLLFCCVFALLSFSLHYTLPAVAWSLVILAFLIGVGIPAILAANAMKRKLSDPTYQPSWYLFIALTCFVAFLIGAIAGSSNYATTMQKYYNVQHLSHYEDIDTNLYVGQQLMDAGRIEFKEGTALDLSHSMGFKNSDMYCVSPIVTQGSPNKASSMDFWAVGKNCCSGVSADFHCPGFSDPAARGVIRLMYDQDRPFYRLAVQQAEATYKMTATHPLFFEWVADSEVAQEEFAKTGRVNYFIGICSYFLLQMFLTVVSTLVFSKLMY